MFMPYANIKVYLAMGFTDMRKSIQTYSYYHILDRLLPPLGSTPDLLHMVLRYP